jgi:hypothetical protein
VFNRTNQRIAEVTGGKSGLEALRAFCLEVLPLDDERVNEARIVIPFWQKAVNDAQKAQIHQQSMAAWLDTIRQFLAEAREAGDVRAAVDDSILAGQLLNMLLGAQIEAALSPESGTDFGHAAQLDGYLTLLAA